MMSAGPLIVEAVKKAGMFVAKATQHVAVQSTETGVVRAREIPGSTTRRAIARHCVPPRDSIFAVFSGSTSSQVNIGACAPGALVPGFTTLPAESIETQLRHNGALAGSHPSYDQIRQDQR